MKDALLKVAAVLRAAAAELERPQEVTKEVTASVAPAPVPEVALPEAEQTKEAAIRPPGRRPLGGASDMHGRNHDPAPSAGRDKQAAVRAAYDNFEDFILGRNST